MEKKIRIQPPPISAIDEIIAEALDEDLSTGDITTDNLDLPDKPMKAELIARENGILAGWSVFKRVFFHVDETVLDSDFVIGLRDGDSFSEGDTIATLYLTPSALLKGERVALNLLSHMSAIATATNRIVMMAGPNGPAIADTRKTIPGLRILQKYAVRVGGGMNHRMSLAHAVMIKNNHIALVGGIENAVKQIRSKVGHTIKIEVEVSTADEIDEALECKVDILMLDNFPPELVREVAGRIKGKAILELSGGINEDNIRDYISTGADVISIGALTNSVKALDMAIHSVY
jgi:nicotinate-nucleotide pyrophosphorylase (carboxylating)